ncbi:MAG TPA: hypothetical protein VIV60_08975 [Polyangiaceae bacterium]
MKKSLFWDSLSVVLILGAPVEWCARTIAIAEIPNVPFGNSSTGFHFSIASLVPLAIAAAASLRAFKAYGLRAQLITILVTVAVHGWCMYESEGGARQALLAKAWTGSALAAGLAWIFSSVCISVAASLLMLGFAVVKRWRHSRPAS